MPYSAVTQPRPVPRKNGGAWFSRLAVQQHMGVPEFDEAGPFRVLENARFQAGGAHFVGAAAGGAGKRSHERSLEVRVAAVT
jgi:hypothetical protein